MSELISDNFIKRFSHYHRLIYISLILLMLIHCFLGFVDDTRLVIIVCATLFTFGILDAVMTKLRYNESACLFLICKMIEITAYNVILAFLPFNSLMIAAMIIMNMIISTEIILHGSDFDSSTAFYRKMLVLLPIVVNLTISLGLHSESLWLCCLLLQSVSVVVIYFIVDWFISLSVSYERINSKLNMEKADVEVINSKLIDYQERVKSINEKINYQKIEMARTNFELEQVNTEIESLNEVMKYMASTFDVLKCIDVITDAIMDVKMPKVCALFIDKDVYMNKYSSCIIKSNYTSIQRRLKKEIEEIYSYVVKMRSPAQVITGTELAKFKFIGDANINSLAILPLIDNDEVYGIMIVGSDVDNFFDKGLKYYETCIVEFNVSIKSTRLYLRMTDMARKDGLTGIYNRIYFSEIFQKAAYDAVEKKKPLSVALFDIDKFKNVNDTYGHLAGDRVIKMVASVGQKYAEKNNGFASRYGGEEFLLVLPGYDSSEALKILEAMHEEIKNTVVSFDDNKINVNVCIGLSSYPDLCKDTRILVSRADKAMYYGKRNGRGRLVLDNPEIDEEA